MYDVATGMKIARTWKVRMLELNPGWYIHTVTLSGFFVVHMQCYYLRWAVIDKFISVAYTNKITLLT